MNATSEYLNGKSAEEPSPEPASPVPLPEYNLWADARVDPHKPNIAEIPTITYLNFRTLKKALRNKTIYRIVVLHFAVDTIQFQCGTMKPVVDLAR